ncbi:MAG: hypothetical protein J5518_06190 [Lachnospiraceae bacterium]|nr:hypothetical protein [Lachnospiraceae bacterium]
MEDRMEQMIWERINATIDAAQSDIKAEPQGETEAVFMESMGMPEAAVPEEAAVPVMEAEQEEITQPSEPLDESIYTADPDDDHDITEKIKQASEEELHELKRWLFGENIRLRGERLELKELRIELEEERQNQDTDRQIYLNHIAQERKEIRKEEELVAEKLEIIKKGFAALDADRRELKEREARLTAREAVLDTKLKYSYTAENPEVADVLFMGVTSYLMLKKRYKDLMKMYHPDSVGGSTDMVLAINRVYDKLLKQYGRSREIL